MGLGLRPLTSRRLETLASLAAAYHGSHMFTRTVALAVATRAPAGANTTSDARSRATGCSHARRPSIACHRRSRSSDVVATYAPSGANETRDAPGLFGA